MPKINTGNSENPIGQYASDHILHAGDSALNDDFLGVKTRGDGSFGFHGEPTLFDEARGYVDEATGVIATDVDDEILALEGMRIDIQGSNKGRRVSEPVDAADAWLSQHDPSYKK